MRVLIACEFSGIVRNAFAAIGHDAWSCDILPTETPGQHIQGDVLKVVDNGWDLMIAHPPCTYLTYAGIAHWDKPGRAEARESALDFFIQLYDANIPRVCVENPVGYANTVFRKPDQIIHPYYFGDPHVKRTSLWLRGLPCLEWDKTVKKPEPLSVQYRRPGKNYKGGEVKNRYFVDAATRDPHVRSRSFRGIADAMAAQWGNL